MSIEIIEKPKHKCTVCGCVYSFEKEDFQEEKDYYFREVFVICPICGKRHILEKEKRPSLL